MWLIQIFCYIVSILLLSGTNNPKYQWIFILPLIYGIMLQFNRYFKQNAFKYISLFLLFLTSFIRYVVTPFIMMLGEYSGSSANFYDISYFHYAIFLMAYEEIVFFIVIFYFAPKIYKRAEENKGIVISDVKKYAGVKILIIIAIVLVCAFPVLLSRYHFVPNLIGSEYDSIVENDLSGGYSLFVVTARYFMIILLLAYFHGKYKMRNSNIYLFLSIMIVGINSLFVNDMSRFGILIPAVAFIYYLVQLYPLFKRKILSLSSVFIGASLAYTTFMKMFSEARGGSDKSNDIGSWGYTLQVYFQNVGDVVIGIASLEKIKISHLYMFINDVFSNSAILSSLSVRKMTSLYIFNYEYSGGYAFDKILPNVCAGHSYFGFVGAPIIIAVFCYLGMKFDAKSRQTTDIFMKFVFIITAINCSLAHMVYYTMMVGFLINNTLFMYVLLKLYDKPTLKYNELK